MRELFDDIRRWRKEGQRVALATVIETWGSAPRRPGAKMAICADGGFVGSVSGGCVEGAVAEAGLETIRSGQPQLLLFGVADELAWEVGLACGGEVQVFVERVEDERLAAVEQWASEERSAVAITVVAGPEEALGRWMLVDGQGGLQGNLELTSNNEIRKSAGESLRDGAPRRVRLAETGFDLFVEPLLPRRPW
ncbi:MAG: hypothetical protein HC802_03135 [Caldilineaceae bacterium]|nr:hypothetical protein [Caldilineaceae bacterium]